MPAVLPRVRKTFVAPMLPLPTVRTCHTPGFAGQVSSRDRSEQIGDGNHGDITYDIHSPTVGKRARRRKWNTISEQSRIALTVRRPKLTSGGLSCLGNASEPPF